MTQGSDFTSIRRLSSGNYQARWRPRHGKHLSATFPTILDCEEWLAAVKEKVRADRKERAFDRIETGVTR